EPGAPRIIPKYSCGEMLARLHDDVDQGQPAFVLDDTQGALQGRANGLRGDDGTFPIEAIGLGHLGEVDWWIVQPCANAGIGYGTLAHAGDVDGMFFRIIIRAVVEHDDEQREMMMRRRPQGARRVQQVAIGLEVYTHFPTVTMRQDTTERPPHTLSQPPPTPPPHTLTSPPPSP